MNIGRYKISKFKIILFRNITDIKQKIIVSIPIKMSFFNEFYYLDKQIDIENKKLQFPIQFHEIFKDNFSLNSLKKFNKNSCFDENLEYYFYFKIYEVEKFKKFLIKFTKSIDKNEEKIIVYIKNDEKVGKLIEEYLKNYIDKKINDFFII